MPRIKKHQERHVVERIGWLRAAVLGANDGLVSTASLLAGVAAASADKPSMMLTGVAGLVAGAMSMAAGEYISVSSQADTEAADLAREKAELRDQPEAELAELAGIYISRGLTPELAQQVAVQMMQKNALEAHARDELGMSAHLVARPVQAAFASALTFSVGAALPLLVVLLTPLAQMVPAIFVSTLVFLAVLGALGARAGGARMAPAVWRVTFWGAFALAITALIGRLFGAVV